MESAEKELADWRARIDVLDEQIVRLISERAAAATAIGEIKHRSGMAVYEPQREQNVFAHVKRVNPGPLPDQEMQHIYERLIDVMRTLQKRG
jgi:chorismate mutase